MRCELEARNHHLNSFVTLTYNNDTLPEDLGLNPTHLEHFLKRLRKKKWPFRYYACGEYGDLTQRPHYHACLFGMDFQDKKLLSRNNGNSLYTSQELNDIWQHGHTSIGDVTFESAAYVARYVLKKRLSVNGRRQTHSHFTLDTETGELTPIYPPFVRMSLATPIAGQWLSKNHGDIYNANKDFLVIRGKKLRPPKAFDKLFDAINPSKMENIRQQRIKNRKILTSDQLRAHEKITRARITGKKKV